MVNPNATPEAAAADQPCIGLIGMGAMGRMYAKLLSDAGWKKIYVCDLPSKYEELKREYEGFSGVVVVPDGHHVSRISDFIMYSVEAEYLEKVVAQYGPSTKVGAIVAGQTSVKAPEREAFERHLPSDVNIVSCHSLHGPTISPFGQALILIQHRAPDWALTLVENILRPFGSRYVYLSYEDHDLVTANTQAVTHAAFLSMGTAWASSSAYPWEHGQYVGGIENVKVNIMLRIYSNKWHVYAGLAILNPSARLQINQYAQSATELYKLMLAGDEATLRTRMYHSRDVVFGTSTTTSPVVGDLAHAHRRPILLSEDILDRFSLGRTPAHTGGPLPSSSVEQGDLARSSQVGRRQERGIRANSHLSLLAMVDCWARLGIQPFVHLELAATPIFRMWLGVAESLFRSSERLDNAIEAAVHDVSHRSDDLEFVVAARGWSQCVSFGSFELYRRRFEQTAAFFESRFEDATVVGSAMIQAIMDSSKHS